MMNNDNIDILKKPETFKVPNGYFDTLSSRIMQNIPEEMETKVISLSPKQKEPQNSKKFWYGIIGSTAVAACLAIIFSTGIKTDNSDDVLADNIESPIITTDHYDEDVITYSMVDANDIYDYLAGESY